ncbi:MAG: DUF305 domain-containing protein [Solirubrobacteraceae bacterium]
MKKTFRYGLLGVAAVLAGVIAGCGGSGNSATTANAADRAFVAEMIPHHKLAVQMGQMAEMQGTHPQIKSLASSIIATQNREISVMTGIASQIGAKVDNQAAGGQMQMGGVMGSNAQTLGIAMDKMGMSMNMTQLSAAKPFDREFTDMMTPHHQGAITMARAELAKGKNPKLRTLAQSIISDQTREISEMNAWRIKWYGAPVPPGAAVAAGGTQGM